MNKFTISKISISFNEIYKNKFPIQLVLQYVKQKICVYSRKTLNQNEFLIIILINVLFLQSRMFI